MLFLESLAQAIRKHKNITGVTMNNIKYNVCLHADDALIMLKLILKSVYPISSLRIFGTRYKVKPTEVKTCRMAKQTIVMVFFTDLTHMQNDTQEAGEKFNKFILTGSGYGAGTRTRYTKLCGKEDHVSFS
ncbi:hypothetical protein CHARACLAT_000871 [Characodon lateralis]|uniref:Uncharacterized protein n=1 Tax=Characodon lateralis TaxID=208331 RepID=A0ABU7DD44_9TELE|nr:hypothetical protein [Characodon lateralis]